MAGAEICSAMDQFNHYENIYNNITVTVHQAYLEKEVKWKFGPKINNQAQNNNLLGLYLKTA